MTERPTIALSEARALLEQAIAARTHAYAPYSRFPVGAALLGEDGTVYPGVNVENASYGMTTCAEQGAVAHAIARGARGFTAIAVIGPENKVPCPPCGRCRQILLEADAEMMVITAGSGGTPILTPIRELLPAAFDADHLQ